MKREHRYRVTVEHVQHAKPDALLHESLQFETANHDEILGIVDRLRSGSRWDADTTAALAIGLKLFGEAALRHRDDPLFAAMLVPLRGFVEELKARSSSATQQASAAGQ